MHSVALLSRHALMLRRSSMPSAFDTHRLKTGAHRHAASWVLHLLHCLLLLGGVEGLLRKVAGWVEGLHAVCVCRQAGKQRQGVRHDMRVLCFDWEQPELTLSTAGESFGVSCPRAAASASRPAC